MQHRHPAALELYENREFSYPYWLENIRFSNKRLDYPASSGGANGKRYNVYECLYSTGERFRIPVYDAQVGDRLLAVLTAKSRASICLGDG
ncbi:hypothetical protein [Paractinoplanes maris]|uniref:hypothetical protein n=1 Tax=Paractinoplanes maris TaxID=1734446 RepID=UPI002021FD44|nr:hypothetical protein [Actinoplanes maris]